MMIEIDRYTPVEVMQRMPGVGTMGTAVVNLVRPTYHDDMLRVRKDQQLARDEAYVQAQLDKLGQDRVESLAASLKRFPGATQIGRVVGRSPFVSLVMNALVPRPSEESFAAQLSEEVPEVRERPGDIKNDLPIPPAQEQIHRMVLVGIKAERLLFHMDIKESDVHERTIELLSLIDNLALEADVPIWSEAHPIWEALELSKQQIIRLQGRLAGCSVAYLWRKAVQRPGAQA